jgi:hypothetical protein
MTTISVELSEEQERALKERARALGVRPEELAAAVLTDGLAASDIEFRDAAKRIVEKNCELYERLR